MPHPRTQPLEADDMSMNIQHTKEYGTLSGNESSKDHTNGADGKMTNGEHCHQRDTGDLLDKKARRKLLIASLLCLVFMIGEIVGGVLANSLAIATDAAHLLTDFASFMISLFAIYLASRPATKKMSFGWYRAEVMGALVSVLLIWVVTGILVYMAIQRVISEDYEIDAVVMLITAGVGVAFNIVMGCTLHDHGHSHGGGGSHGHSHGGSSKPHSHSDNHDTVIDVSETTADDKHLLEKKKQENINVRAAFIHVVGDFIQSIGVFIAALVIFFRPDWKIADPICTFLFSVLVLFTTLAILKDTILVLMEATPRGMSFSAVKEALCKVPGVKELHNLRIWSLTLNKIAISVHLAIDDKADAQLVRLEAGRVMNDKFGVHECTIQIEPFTDDMNDCTQCQDPED